MTKLPVMLGLAALMCAASVPMASTPAEAAIVCNRDGDCWRTRQAYKYKPSFGLRIYGDNWKWRDRDAKRYRWRDAGEGRGYWRRGVWITF